MDPIVVRLQALHLGGGRFGFVKFFFALRATESVSGQRLVFGEIPLIGPLRILERNSAKSAERMQR